MNRSDWLKVGTFVVGIFIASGIPAAVQVGSMAAEIKEAKSRAAAAEVMVMSTRQRVDDSQDVLRDTLWKELREINTRLSRIEGAIKLH